MENGGVKEPVKASGMPLATYAAIALVAGMLLAAYYFGASSPGPGPQATPTPIPSPSPSACINAIPQTHSVANATEYLERVMATYQEMMRSGVPVPAYDSCSGTWSAIVRIQAANNGEQRVLVRFNDSPAFNLDRVYVETVRAPFVSDSRVVTNGTLLMAGKINCSNGSAPRMMEFSDPYCPSCLLGDVKIQAFKAAFNGTLDFEYHVLPSTMQLMENSFGRDDVGRFAYYAVCTQKQGMLDGFMPCAEQKYRMKGVQAPLTVVELDACLPAGLNRSQFDACLPTAYAEVSFDKKLAQTYGVTETPVILFDCQYRVLPEYLEHGFCSIYHAAGCPANAS